MKTTFIYFLRDPKNPIKGYVGKANDPKDRLKDHLKDNKPCYRTNWIRALKFEGLKPQLEILDEVPYDAWEFWEREYIRIFRAIGFHLTNGTDGGDGLSNPTEETRAKMRGNKNAVGNSGFLGKKHSEESKEKNRQAHLGKVPTDEQRQKNREGQFRRLKRKNCASIYRGVSCKRKKWRATIVVRKKQIRLGVFLTEIKAAKAYDAAAKIYFGSAALINFPK